MNTLFLRNRVFENWTPSWREREVELHRVEGIAAQEPQPGFDRDCRRESVAVVTPESRNSRSRSRAQSPSPSPSSTSPSPSRSCSPAASTISTGSSASDSSSDFDFDRTPDREPSSYNTGTTTHTIMAEHELHSIIKSLHGCVRNHNYADSASLLSRAKLALLHLNALIPSPKSSTEHLKLARETLELGALISIRQQSPADFTRYYQQLQPFYALPAKQLPRQGSQASKITGLYLLLLLTQNDNAGFHTLLEGLEILSAQEGHSLEDDQSIQYPVKLQEALMEGSYDRVWGLTGRARVPSEEFGIFADVLINTIRTQIALNSEKAYTSIPVSDAKSLLFLDSEGSVVKFAESRGWHAKDGRLWFPRMEEAGSEGQSSGMVIENTLGYARELEMIV